MDTTTEEVVVADATTDTTHAAAPAKIPRAKWSEPMIIRLKANKDPDSAAVWLVNALVALNLAHGTIDQVVGADAGTTMKFLKSGVDQPGLATVQVDRLLLLLANLHGAGAFTPKGLDVVAALNSALQMATTIDRLRDQLESIGVAAVA